MKNNRLTKLAAAFALMCITLTACTNGNDKPQWEDTLPSAVTVTAEKDTEIITLESNPPISIEVPETTTATEKKTELATTLSADTEEETEISPSVTGVPEVPVSEFTSTSPITAPPITETTTPSYAETSDSIVENSEEISSPTAFTEETALIKNASAESPYVFEDPISRPYCYGTLDTDKRLLYDIIIKAIEKRERKVVIPDTLNVTSEDYCYVYELIYNNEHSVFYIDTQMKYSTSAKTKRLVSAQLSYIYTDSEIDTMQKKIDAQADKIIGGISEEMSAYDIVRYFYDYLVSSCVYDEAAPNCRDIYGCFVDKKAVCGGYAKAFSYLCDRVGIPSLTITGDSEKIPHMWNMVKLGGAWYHIDVTSGYVGNTLTPYIRYDYFCVNDETIAKTKTVYEQDYAYPAALSNKYNYYVYNNLVADSIESAEEILSNSIIAASAKKERAVQFACADDETFEKVRYKLFDQSQAHALTILENVYEFCENKYHCEAITYNSEKNTRVIKIFLDYLDRE